MLTGALWEAEDQPYEEVLSTCFSASQVERFVPNTQKLLLGRGRALGRARKNAALPVAALLQFVGLQHFSTLIPPLAVVR